MGLTKWMAYYANMQGVPEYEPVDREAMGIYSEALTRRDDAALRRLPPSQAQHLKQLRRALAQLHQDAIAVAQDNAGGGTMYLDFFSSAAVDDEELIAKLLRSRPGSATAEERRRIAARQAKNGRALITARPSASDLADLSADAKKQTQADAAKLPGDLRALETATGPLSGKQTLRVWEYVDLAAWLDAGGAH